MKRTGIVLLLVTLVGLIGYGIYRSQVSDMTKIKWLLDGAVAAFNDEDRGGVVAVFDPDYEAERGTPANTEQLGAALSYLFLKGTYRARLPEEDLERVLDPKVRHALARFVLILEQGTKSGGTWREVWRIRVTAHLHEVDGVWLIRSSSHETVSGRRPQ